MKRRFGTVIAMVLCFILTVVSVYADDGKGQNPDYVTDYYMIVQSTPVSYTHLTLPTNSLV